MLEPDLDPALVRLFDRWSLYQWEADGCPWLPPTREWLEYELGGPDPDRPLLGELLPSDRVILDRYLRECV